MDQFQVYAEREIHEPDRRIGQKLDELLDLCAALRKQAPPVLHGHAAHEPFSQFERGASQDAAQVGPVELLHELGVAERIASSLQQQQQATEQRIGEREGAPEPLQGDMPGWAALPGVDRAVAAARDWASRARQVIKPGTGFFESVRREFLRLLFGAHKRHLWLFQENQPLFTIDLAGVISYCSAMLELAGSAFLAAMQSAWDMLKHMIEWLSVMCEYIGAKRALDLVAFAARQLRGLAQVVASSSFFRRTAKFARSIFSWLRDVASRLVESKDKSIEYGCVMLSTIVERTFYMMLEWPRCVTRPALLRQEWIDAFWSTACMLVSATDISLRMHAINVPNEDELFHVKMCEELFASFEELFDRLEQFFERGARDDATSRFLSSVSARSSSSSSSSSAASSSSSSSSSSASARKPKTTDELINLAYGEGLMTMATISRAYMARLRSEESAQQINNVLDAARFAIGLMKQHASVTTRHQNRPDKLFSALVVSNMSNLSLFRWFMEAPDSDGATLDHQDSMDVEAAESLQQLDSLGMLSSAERARADATTPLDVRMEAVKRRAAYVKSNRAVPAVDRQAIDDLLGIMEVCQAEVVSANVREFSHEKFGDVVPASSSSSSSSSSADPCAKYSEKGYVDSCSLERARTMQLWLQSAFLRRKFAAETLGRLITRGEKNMEMDELYELYAHSESVLSLQDKLQASSGPLADAYVDLDNAVGALSEYLTRIEARVAESGPGSAGVVEELFERSQRGQALPQESAPRKSDPAKSAPVWRSSAREGLRRRRVQRVGAKHGDGEANGNGKANGTAEDDGSGMSAPDPERSFAVSTRSDAIKAMKQIKKSTANMANFFNLDALPASWLAPEKFRQAEIEKRFDFRGEVAATVYDMSQVMATAATTYTDADFFDTVHRLRDVEYGRIYSYIKQLFRACACLENAAAIASTTQPGDQLVRAIQKLQSESETQRAFHRQVEEEVRSGSGPSSSSMALEAAASSSSSPSPSEGGADQPLRHLLKLKENSRGLLEAFSEKRAKFEEIENARLMTEKYLNVLWGDMPEAYRKEINAVLGAGEPQEKASSEQRRFMDTVIGKIATKLQYARFVHMASGLVVAIFGKAVVPAFMSLGTVLNGLGVEHDTEKIRDVCKRYVMYCDRLSSYYAVQEMEFHTLVSTFEALRDDVIRNAVRMVELKRARSKWNWSGKLAVVAMGWMTVSAATLALVPSFRTNILAGAVTGGASLLTTYLMGKGVGFANWIYGKASSAEPEVEPTRQYAESTVKTAQEALGVKQANRVLTPEALAKIDNAEKVQLDIERGVHGAYDAPELDSLQQSAREHEIFTHLFTQGAATTLARNSLVDDHISRNLSELLGSYNQTEAGISTAHVLLGSHRQFFESRIGDMAQASTSRDFFSSFNSTGVPVTIKPTPSSPAVNTTMPAPESPAYAPTSYYGAPMAPGTAGHEDLAAKVAFKKSVEMMPEMVGRGQEEVGFIQRFVTGARKVGKVEQTAIEELLVKLKDALFDEAIRTIDKDVPDEARIPQLGNVTKAEAIKQLERARNLEALDGPIASGDSYAKIADSARYNMMRSVRALFNRGFRSELLGNLRKFPEMERAIESDNFKVPVTLQTPGGRWEKLPRELEFRNLMDTLNRAWEYSEQTLARVNEKLSAIVRYEATQSRTQYSGQVLIGVEQFKRFTQDRIAIMSDGLAELNRAIRAIAQGNPDYPKTESLLQLEGARDSLRDQIGTMVEANRNYIADPTVGGSKLLGSLKLIEREYEALARMERDPSQIERTLSILRESRAAREASEGSAEIQDLDSKLESQSVADMAMSGANEVAATVQHTARMAIDHMSGASVRMSRDHFASIYQRHGFSAMFREAASEVTNQLFNLPKWLVSRAAGFAGTYGWNNVVLRPGSLLLGSLAFLHTGSVVVDTLVVGAVGYSALHAAFSGARWLYSRFSARTVVATDDQIRKWQGPRVPAESKYVPRPVDSFRTRLLSIARCGALLITGMLPSVTAVMVLSGLAYHAMAEASAASLVSLGGAAAGFLTSALNVGGIPIVSSILSVAGTGLGIINTASSWLGSPDAEAGADADATLLSNINWMFLPYAMGSVLYTVVLRPGGQLSQLARLIRHTWAGYRYEENPRMARPAFLELWRHFKKMVELVRRGRYEKEVPGETELGKFAGEHMNQLKMPGQWWYERYVPELPSQQLYPTFKEDEDFRLQYNEVLNKLSLELSDETGVKSREDFARWARDANKWRKVIEVLENDEEWEKVKRTSGLPSRELMMQRAAPGGAASVLWPTEMELAGEVINIGDKQYNTSRLAVLSVPGRDAPWRKSSPAVSFVNALREMEERKAGKRGDVVSTVDADRLKSSVLVQAAQEKVKILGSPDSRKYYSKMVMGESGKTRHLVALQIAKMLFSLGDAGSELSPMRAIQDLEQNKYGTDWSRLLDLYSRSLKAQASMVKMDYEKMDRGTKRELHKMVDAIYGDDYIESLEAKEELRNEIIFGLSTGLSQMDQVD